MHKVTDIFQNKDRTFSFELFPPKTDNGYQQLLLTINELAALKPDFFSCTYGAGGGSRDKTFDIVEHIQTRHHIPAVAHLTCVCHTKEEIKNILIEIKRRGVCNVLALRGDPPKDNPDWKPGPDNFKYSSELCAEIRSSFNEHFSIGVAGFPEGHVLCPDRDQDAKFLKLKFDNGADYVITQLFFNNQDYFDYVKRLRALGINARVLPGILPITDYHALLKFSALCGATITDEVKHIFAPIADDKEKVAKAGIDFAIHQCQALLNGGAPGLHFYALNKLHPVADILKAIRP
jgi:methylenetetrahydrofolate reductase (NADPH)